MDQEKTVGILGGMGPQATADFMAKIIQATCAETDQENIHMLVDCNPKVPPRVEAILHGGESSGPAMARMAARLEQAGADFLVIACNTAHYYYKDVAEAVHIPVLNLLDMTAAFLKQQKIDSILVLGTEALLRTGLYKEALAKQGIQTLEPDDSCLPEVLAAIAAVKSGYIEQARMHAIRIMQWCGNHQIHTALLGCTELPIAFQGIESIVRLVDPAIISAKAIVLEAKGIAAQ